MSSELTEIAVAIAQPLKILPNQILDYLTVHIGDVVTKQTVLASKKGLFGLGGVELRSPVEGIVHNIDLQTGVLIVHLGDTNIKIPNSVKEEISLKLPKPQSNPQLKDINQHAKFKRTASSNREMIEAIFGCGHSQGNGWFVEYSFDIHSILPEMEGRILLITKLPTLSELFKASAIGIAGIIVTTNDIDASCLQAIKTELSGKSHLGFLVLPATTNLATLHGVLLEIDGEGKKLLYEKK